MIARSLSPSLSIVESNEKARANRMALGAGIFVFFLSALAAAHERFIKHALKHPLHYDFFRHGHGGFLGMNDNIWLIGLNVMTVLTAFLVIWFVRYDLTEFAMRRVLGSLRGAPQRFVQHVACFITDRPIRNRSFHTFGEWVVIFFLRSPGLVLMYSAANDSLVMPSYPLEPSSAAFFKFAQVGLAILILTQTLLPLCGALIFGTWLYLNRWGWMVAIDAVPVLTVAVVYVTSPWNSHKLAITSINAMQMRWLRLTLGAGFFALGWLKVYNHNLVAGVADNYPSVMDDPMVKLMAMGTDPAFRRETWIVSFGMAEIMSGFMLATGIFSRLWATIMCFMFTKLMLVDFGWEEIPHIYPIAGVLTVIFSNKLSCEFHKVEVLGERLGRQGRLGARLGMVAGPALGISILMLFPLLYAISFIDRSNL